MIHKLQISWVFNEIKLIFFVDWYSKVNVYNFEDIIARKWNGAFLEKKIDFSILVKIQMIVDLIEE